MRDNSDDRTIERNYVQKWRFLVRDYERVKAKRHPQFRFVQDFYRLPRDQPADLRQVLQPLPSVGGGRGAAAP